MSTLSNVEFLRRLKQGRGVYTPSFASDFESEAYFESMLSGQMLQNQSDEEISNLIKNSANLNNLYQTEPTVDQIEKSSAETLNIWDRTQATINEVTYNATKGILGFFEGVGDFFIGAAGEIGSWFGADDQWAKDAVSYDWSSRGAQAITNITPINWLDREAQDWDFSDEGVQKYNQDLYEASWVNELPSWFHDGYNAVIENIANMVPSIALGIATGGTSIGATIGSKLISVGSMALSAAGSSVSGALEENPEADLSNVMLYGVASGAVEGASEYVFSALGGIGSKIAGKVGISTGKLANLLPNSVGGFFGKQVSKNFLGQLTAEAVEEGAEEVFSDVLQPLVKSIYNGKSVKENYDEYNVSSMVESFTLGAITAGIMGGANIAIGRKRAGGKTGFAAQNTLAGVQEDYNKLIDLQNKGQATEITSDGSLQYNERAQAIVKDMADKLEQHNALIDKMSQKEKAQYFKALTGISVEDGFKKLKQELEVYNNQYEELKKNGANITVLENIKKNRIDPISTIIEEGEEKWVNRKIVEQVNDFVPSFENASQVKLAGDDKILRKHLRTYLKHSSSKNELTLSEDIKNIREDFSRLDKAMTDEEKISFGKRLTNLSTIFEDLTDDRRNELLSVANEYINSMKNTTVQEEIVKYQIYNFQDKNFGKFNPDIRIMFFDGEENGEHARYDRKKNTIYINRQYANKTSYAKVFAHEYVGHVIYDNYLEAERDQIVEEIKQTDWYKENKESFERTYNFNENIDNEKYNSELFANYLENAVFNETSDISRVFNVLTKPNRLFTSIKTLLKTINKSSADNLFLDELSKTLRLVRSAGYRAWRLAINSGVSFSRNLYDKDSVEYLIRGDISEEIKPDYKYKRSNVYDINDSDFDTTDFECYDENAKKYNKLAINVNDNMVLNFLRYINSLTLEDLTYDDTFESMTQSLTERLEKMNSYLKKGNIKKFTQQDFINAQRLYNYLVENNNADLNRFYKKSESYARRMAKENGEEFDSEDWSFDDFDIGNIFEEAANFKNNYKSFMLKNYKYDVDEKKIISDSSEVQIAKVDEQEVKDIMEDNASQLKADENIDQGASEKVVNAKIENAVNKIEQASVSERYQKQISDFNQDILSLSTVNAQNISTIIEANKKLAKQIRSFRTAEYNLTAQEYADNFEKLEVVTKEMAEEAYNLACDLAYAFGEINKSLVAGKGSGEGNILPVADYADLSSRIKGDLSSQQIGDVNKSLMDVISALYETYYRPATKILEHFSELTSNLEQGEGDFYFSELADEYGNEYYVTDNEGNYLEVNEGSGHYVTNTGDNIKTKQEELKTDWEGLKNNFYKSGVNKALSNWGKQRHIRNTTYVTSTQLETIKPISEETLTGYTKGDVEKSIVIKWVREEDYKRIMNIPGVAIHSRTQPGAISSRKNLVMHYALIEENLGDTKNLSGFSWYNLNAKNANTKNSMVVNSFFNLGNNMLVYENIGSFIRTKVFGKRYNDSPFGRRTAGSPNAVAVLIDFGKDLVSSQDALTVLADYEIYPVFNIASTQLETKEVPSKGDPKKKEKVTVNLNPYRFDTTQYIFNLNPSNRDDLSDLRKVPSWKIGKKIDEGRKIATYSYAINRALEKSRTSVNTEIDKIQKAKKKELNDIYYAKNKIRKAEKQGYKKGLKENDKLLSKEFKKGVEEGKKIITERIEKQKQLAKEVAAENQIYNGFKNHLTGTFFSTKSVFKEERKRLTAEVENDKSLNKLTEKEKTAYVKKGMREFASRYKEKLIDYAKNFSGLDDTYDAISGAINYIENGKKSTIVDYLSANSIVDTNVLENNTLYNTKTSTKPLTEEEMKVINTLISEGKGSIPTGEKNAKIVQFQVPSSADSILPATDVERRVEVQNPDSINPLQQKINLNDPAKVKLEKLINNITYSQKWMNFQIMLTNSFAGYEKAIFLSNVGDYRMAEMFSQSLRRMNNVGTNFIERGMPTYDENGQRILDEKGRVVLTRPLTEANYLTKEVIKKKGANKKWRQKLSKRFTDAEEKIVRDQFAYMLCDLAKDTNIKYANDLKKYLVDFVIDNNIDVEYTKAFEKTFAYIDKQVKNKENIHYQELVKVINDDMLNFYNDGAVKQSQINELLSKIPDITDDVVVKDTFGKSFERFSFINPKNESLFNLNKILGKINGLSLVDTLNERFGNRTDIFLEEYEEVSKPYLDKAKENIEKITALESDFQKDFYLDLSDEKITKLLSEINKFLEKKADNSSDFLDTLQKKKNDKEQVSFTDLQDAFNDFSPTKNLDNQKKDILNNLVIDVSSLNESNKKLLLLNNALDLVDDSNLIKALNKKFEDSKTATYGDYRKVLNSFVSLENLENRQIQKLQNAIIKGFENPSTKRIEATQDTIINEYKDTPEFFEAIKIYRENLDNLNAYIHEGGMISDDDFNNMKNAYPNYVPTRRHKIQLGSGVVGRTDLEHIVRYRDGSNEVILPLNETIVNMIKIAPFKVELNKQLNTIFNANKKGNHLISFTEMGEDQTRFTDVIEQDVNDILLSSRDGNTINFRHYNSDTNKMELISANMENHVYSAFRTEKFFKSTLKMPSKLVSTFKRLVTSMNPFFIFRNAQRDIVDAYATSRSNLGAFTKELGKSVVEIIKGDSVEWNLYVQNGGLASSYFDTSNSNVLFEDLGKAYQESNSKVHKVLHSIEKANMVVEQLARFTEFKVKHKEYLQEGMSKEMALSYALLDAAQITTDFSRGGTLAKWLNRNFVPFLNAQIQGWCKMSNIILHPRDRKELASILVKIIILSIVPEVLNMLINGGNPDYEALPDYTKESYYLFNTGNGNFLKIPRARIVGTFSSLFNNVVDIFRGSQNPTEALNDFWDTATTNLAPVDVSGGINYIGKPISDAMKNITWYGQSIDKQSDLTKRPSSRYDTETSEVAKVIGKIFNWSPKRIDYVLAQSTGVVGDILLPLTTQSGSVENTLTNFLTSNTSISAVQNNKYRGEFYDYRTEVQYDASDGDPVAKVVYGYLSRAIDEINVLEEQADQTPNEAEKYAIYLTIRESYKQAVENAENFKKVLSHMDQATLESGDKYALTEAYYQAFGAEAALKYYNSTTYKKATYSNKTGLSYDDYYNLYFAVRSASSKEEAKQMIQSIVGNDPSQVAAMLKLLGVSLTDSEKSLAKNYLSKYLISDELADLSL